MKAKLSNYYRSAKTGQPVFVYVVTGTPEELAAYKAAKGTYYREDKDGNVLHFATRALSNNRNEQVVLNITTNGNIVADDLNKVLAQNATLEDYILREQARVMAAQALARGGVQSVAMLQAQPAPSVNEVLNVDENVEVLDEADIPA